MGKGKRKHFDMATSKWSPLPKVKPEDIFKTEKSTVPVLAKNSAGKTIVGFPEVSVSTFFPPKDDKEITNIHRVEAEVDLMKEDASEFSLEKGQLFVQSFLHQIKLRFKFLIRQISTFKTEVIRLTAEDEAIRAIAEKTDSDLWDIRTEFDALNNKMDAVLETFEKWGVPLDTDYVSCHRDDTADIPFDTKDGSEEVSGEEVAEMVKGEVEKSRRQKVAEHNERIINKFNGGSSLDFSDGKKAGQEAAKRLLTGGTTTYISKWGEKEEAITPTKTIKPTAPSDMRTTEKSNVKVYNNSRCSISHYCDMCKFSAPNSGQTGRAVVCKNDKSKYANEIVYGLKDCDRYVSIHATPAKLNDICGWDFSDESQVTH